MGIFGTFAKCFRECHFCMTYFKIELCSVCVCCFRFLSNLIWQKQREHFWFRLMLFWSIKNETRHGSFQMLYRNFSVFTIFFWEQVMKQTDPRTLALAHQRRNRSFKNRSKSMVGYGTLFFMPKLGSLKQNSSMKLTEFQSSFRSLETNFSSTPWEAFVLEFCSPHNYALSNPVSTSHQRHLCVHTKQWLLLGQTDPETKEEQPLAANHWTTDGMTPRFGTTQQRKGGFALAFVLHLHFRVWGVVQPMRSCLWLAKSGFTTNRLLSKNVTWNELGRNWVESFWNTLIFSANGFPRQQIIVQFYVKDTTICDDECFADKGSICLLPIKKGNNATVSTLGTNWTFTNTWIVKWNLKKSKVKSHPNPYGCSSWYDISGN